MQISIDNSLLDVEVAKTSEELERGLMFRKSLPEDHGMLFIFRFVKHYSFWMKNTVIPLSAAFIKKDSTITEIIDLKPLDETERVSKQKIKYVLEVNRGWFDKKGIKVGDKVKGLSG